MCIRSHIPAREARREIAGSYMPRTIIKQFIFHHMHFSSRNTYVSESKNSTFIKVIFSQCRKGECTELSHRVYRVITSPLSEKYANTIGKRDVFENGAVAAMFLRFRALKTVGIHCFLSSPT